MIPRRLPPLPSASGGPTLDLRRWAYRPLKKAGVPADNYRAMTTSDLILEDWATKPLGKAARISIAAGGVITATLVLLLASMVREGSWLFVLAGVALAATSVRAARFPTVIRLSSVMANLIAIPLIAQVI